MRIELKAMENATFTAVYESGNGKGDFPSIVLFDNLGRVFAVLPQRDYPVNYWRDLVMKLCPCIDEAVFEFASNQTGRYAKSYRDSFLAYGEKSVEIGTLINQRQDTA